MNAMPPSVTAHPRGLGALLLALAALSAAACSSAGPMPAVGTGEDEIRSTQIRFADDLRGLVRVEPISTARADYSNNLMVHVPIRNVSGRDLQLQAMCEFLDAGGNPYQDRTARQTIWLPRGATQTWTATSMQSKADDFVVHLWQYQEPDR